MSCQPCPSHCRAAACQPRGVNGGYANARRSHAAHRRGQPCRRGRLAGTPLRMTSGHSGHYGLSRAHFFNVQTSLVNADKTQGTERERYSPSPLPSSEVPPGRTHGGKMMASSTPSAGPPTPGVLLALRCTHARHLILSFRSSTSFPLPQDVNETR